ncbi:MAG: hypothetical protein KTR33_05750 [Gammaproteobacteria bacterium]|nr:hypothetical protein [Gammaproteobacteria bacterium]
MRLRYQLLLAGAVTLVLPLVAYRAVQQMDVALSETRSFELLQKSESSRTLLVHSGLLEELDTAVTHNSTRSLPTDLYAERIRHRTILDGYDDDWINNRLASRSFRYGDNKSTDMHSIGQRLASVKLRLAVDTRNLYLFFEVADDNVVYHDPTTGKLAAGDHVAVYVENRTGGLDTAVFRAVAPGPLFAHRYGRRVDGRRPIVRLHNHRGFWTSVNNGYQLELSIPAPPAGSKIGFAVIDNDNARAQSQDAWIGTIDPAAVALNDAGISGSAAVESMGRMVYPSRAIERLLEDVVPAGSRARLYDTEGWLRADVNQLYRKPVNPALLDPARTHLLNALLYRFFEWIITTQHRLQGVDFPLVNKFELNVEKLEQSVVAAKSHGTGQVTGFAGWNTADTQSVRRYVNLDRDQVMGRMTSVELSGGERFYLLFETNEATANAFTSSAMVRLFSQVTLVSLLVTGCLLLFATWLSWRIRQLTRQARAAVSGEGKHVQRIRASTAHDEIGELSRSFARLVERSAGYTQYLENLASRLSHELRTPLSVVKTSLENIDHNQVDPDAQQLLRRAQSGADQLGTLIRSMSEATRLEQSVQRAEFVEFDVKPWLSNAREAYRGVYPRRRFQLDFQATDAEVYAVPELLQQALDKLVANAVDFSEPHSVIELCTRSRENQLELAIVNEGAQIVEAYADQLFEPMYSERTDPGTEAHLGLGLYIVRLISEAHGGKAWARNLSADKVEVGFSVLDRRGH